MVKPVSKKIVLALKISTNASDNRSREQIMKGNITIINTNVALKATLLQWVV